MNIIEEENTHDITIVDVRCITEDVTPAILNASFYIYTDITLTEKITGGTINVDHPIKLNN